MRSLEHNGNTETEKASQAKANFCISNRHREAQFGWWIGHGDWCTAE